MQGHGHEQEARKADERPLFAINRQKRKSKALKNNGDAFCPKVVGRQSGDNDCKGAKKSASEHFAQAVVVWSRLINKGDTERTETRDQAFRE